MSYLLHDPRKLVHKTTVLAGQRAVCGIATRCVVEGAGRMRTIAGTVPTNCMANILQSGSFSSGISFLPHFFIIASAEAVVWPLLLGTMTSSSWSVM